MVALAVPGVAGTIFSYTAWGRPNVALARAAADDPASPSSGVVSRDVASGALLFDKSCCSPVGNDPRNPPLVSASSAPSSAPVAGAEDVDATSGDALFAVVADSFSANDATTLRGLKPSASSSTFTASGCDNAPASMRTVPDARASPPATGDASAS